MQHPQDHLVQSFSQGSLISPLAAMVSAHLEVCFECRSRYHDLLALEAQSTFLSPLDSKETDQYFNELAGLIDQNPHQAARPILKERTTIEISGQVIQLPRSLDFLKSQKIPWKEFGKKNAIAPLSVGQEGNFYLIYIGPGESVPQHDHSGLEYSYVAAGSYEDGFSTFCTGDFSLSGPGLLHTPRAISSDGCLVISWVEGRLNYFNGLLKPLNSLLWWYLHRA